MMAFALVVLSSIIIVLKADLYGNNDLNENELTACRFQGFLMYETFGCCYMSFVLQAFYRLTRVIYAKYKFLQGFSFNLICIDLQWYFIRHQTPQLSRTQQGRIAQRDFIITRRILFTVVALTLPGLPNMSFTFIANINHSFSGAYYMYRIQWLGLASTVITMRELQQYSFLLPTHTQIEETEKNNIYVTDMHH